MKVVNIKGEKDLLNEVEKGIVAMAYFQGVCDAQKQFMPEDKHKVLQDAAIWSASKILSELGIKPPLLQSLDLYKYLNEMESIAEVLHRDNKNNEMR